MDEAEGVNKFAECPILSLLFVNLPNKLFISQAPTVVNAVIILLITHTRMRACTRAHIRTSAQANKYTRTHTRTHKQTNTHAHTHTISSTPLTEAENRGQNNKTKTYQPHNPIPALGLSHLQASLHPHAPAKGLEAWRPRPWRSEVQTSPQRAGWGV